MDLQPPWPSPSSLLKTLFVLRVSLATLLVNRRNITEERIKHIRYDVFSTDDRTPVTEDCRVPFTFTGKIDKVTIELMEVKQADKAAVDQGQKVAVPQKAMAD